MIAAIRRWGGALWRWVSTLWRARALPVAAAAPQEDPDLKAKNRRARIWCANNAGLGFPEPMRAPGTGYFWKLDLGSLDGVGRRQWRVQKLPVVTS